MDADLFFVIGLVVAAFAIPAIVSAFSDRRAPRGGALMALVGCGMMAFAVSQSPSGYSLSEIPDVFVRVVGRYAN